MTRVLVESWRDENRRKYKLYRDDVLKQWTIESDATTKKTSTKNITSIIGISSMRGLWRAGRLMMINHQSGKKTELKWEDYQFRTGLKEGDFNKNSLKRAR